MTDPKAIFDVRPERWFEREWLLAPAVLFGVVCPAIVMTLNVIRWPGSLDVHLELTQIAMYMVLFSLGLVFLSAWGSYQLNRRAKNIIFTRLESYPLDTLARLSEHPSLKAWQRKLVVERLVAHHEDGRPN